MKAYSIVGMIAAIGLTILAFLLDKTGSAGLRFLLSTVFLLACLAVASRLKNDAAKFGAGAVAAIPLIIVMVLDGGHLWSGIQQAFKGDTPIAISPTETPSSFGFPDPGRSLAVKIDVPADMARTPLQGVVVSGTATNVEEGTALWLFVKSPDDGGRHFLTEEVVVVEGHWSLSTGQVGSDDPLEKGKLYVLEVVTSRGAATQAIRAKLSAAAGGEMFYQDGKMPIGSDIVAKRVVVRV